MENTEEKIIEESDNNLLNDIGKVFRQLSWDGKQKVMEYVSKVKEEEEVKKKSSISSKEVSTILSITNRLTDIERSVLIYIILLDGKRGNK